MKLPLFGIEQFIRQLQKGVKLNGIVLDKITQKDMVTDEVGVPNDVIQNCTLGKYEEFMIILHF